jgi:hypothetical protein
VNIFGRTAGFSRPRLSKQILVSLLSLALLSATWSQKLLAQDTQAPAQAAQTPRYAPQTPEQLQQLVAPIALYPDSLVAQILAASTFPEQIVEADRWLQAHPDLKGDALAKAVDQQPWDPSVKALTAFPSVLGNMDKNLSWTSSLGDAYYNQEQDVMDAIQVMRERAQQAGTLKTTPQQTVAMEDSTITIEPTSSDLVYVPAYDPWLVYGNPIDAWPDWYPYPGIWYDGLGCWFGPAFEIGFFGSFGWGWHHWGCDWHHRFVIYNHNRYYSKSSTFYNRSAYYGRGSAPSVAGARTSAGNRPRAGHVGEGALGVPEDLAKSIGNRTSAKNIGGRSAVYNRPGATAHPFGGNIQAARGYAEPRGQSGIRSGAFSGYDYGGQARSFSSRGIGSFGGGAARGGAGPRGGGHR